MGFGIGDIFKGIGGLIPGVGPIISGLAGIGGALENTAGARTSTMTPTLAPEYKTLSDLLRSRAEQRLRDSVDLSGYQATGLSNINDVFKGLQQSSANNLTARGLADSPVAATVGANLDQARGGQMVNFLNSIPLLQNQLQGEAMSSALPVLNMGRGQTSTGPGSVLGGGLSSAAEMMAYLTGLGALGGNKPKLGGPGYPIGWPGGGSQGPGF